MDFSEANKDVTMPLEIGIFEDVMTPTESTNDTQLQ